MIFNMVGGGGSTAKSSIIVTAPTGSTVTCSKDGVTKNANESGGTWTFKGCDVGTWTITASLGEDAASKNVAIETDGQMFVYRITIAYNRIPVFTFSGAYEIVDDDDNPIAESKDDWNIKLLESESLTIEELRGAENGIDVFLLGGGGGASGESGVYPYSGRYGGGGYHDTHYGIPVDAGIEYPISIGAGGNGGSAGGSGWGLDGTDGGMTSAFGITVNGGKGGISFKGDNYPGSNGAGGTETTAFGYANGATYSKNKMVNDDTTPNENLGYGGATVIKGKGYPGTAGIVIIRNARGGAV